MNRATLIAFLLTAAMLTIVSGVIVDDLLLHQVVATGQPSQCFIGQEYASKLHTRAFGEETAQDLDEEWFEVCQ